MTKFSMWGTEIESIPINSNQTVNDKYNFFRVYSHNIGNLIVKVIEWHKNRVNKSQYELRNFIN